MKGKICLITGAGSGIGKATATALARKEATLVLLCRNATQGESLCSELINLTKNPAISYLTADLADLTQVKQAAEAFKQQFVRLDVLICNAGVFYMNRSITQDGFESHFGINYLSHYLLTRLLQPWLENSMSSRIIHVASDAHAWAKLDLNNLQLTRNFNGLVGYGNSKLAQILFTYEHARRLQGTRVTANVLHPGVVSTGIARTNSFTSLFFSSLGKLFMLTPEQGAATSVYLASSPDVEGVSGKYFEKCKPLNSSATSYNRELAKDFWDMSAKLVGMTD
jgi:NAD(P)-dependent dehydrogenase (short-subunit alcohol dehydrogenase family)